MPRIHTFQNPNRYPHRGKQLRAWLDAHDHTARSFADWIGVPHTRILQWVYLDSVLPPGIDKALMYLTVRDKRVRSDSRRRLKNRNRKANAKYVERMQRLRKGGVETDEDQYL